MENNLHSQCHEYQQIEFQPILERINCIKKNIEKKIYDLVLSLTSMICSKSKIDENQVFPSGFMLSDKVCRVRVSYTLFSQF